MTSSTKSKKYPKNVVNQAECQMYGVTECEKLIDCIHNPPGIFSFRNLEVYLKETRVPLLFSDYHLLVEMIVDALPLKGNALFDKPMPVFGTVSGAFGTMLDHCRIDGTAQTLISIGFLKSIGHYNNFKRTWKKMVSDFLDARPNTELVYMYRCASNYKDFETVIMSGHLAIQDFYENLIDHNHMIAHQVGLTSPQEFLHMNPELDHCLCELVSIEFTDVSPDTDAVSAKELKKRFNTVKWDYAEAIDRFGL